MATEQLLLLLVGALALLALMLSLWLLLVSIRQRKELQGLRQQLSDLVPQANSAVKPEAKPREESSFSAQLDAQERSQPASQPTLRNPAEKYSYVASMAKQGMDAGQIAAALQMAPAEVSQLLRLASLKQGH
jgi:hypothetical protein